MIRRRLFNIASTVLLLLSASIYLWSQSYSRDYSVGFTSRAIRIDLRMVRGHVAIEVLRHPDTFVADEQGLWAYHRSINKDEQCDLEYIISDEPSGERSKSGIAGFYLAREEILPDSEWWIVAPTWALSFLFVGWIPASLLRRWKVTRRHVATVRCIDCGYNLTGNTSGVCPECGTKIEPESRSINPKPAENSAPRA